MNNSRPTIFKKLENRSIPAAIILTFLVVLTLIISFVSKPVAFAQGGDSAGVLIKGFEFFRPYDLPESEDLIALKSRRWQIQEMINTEKVRMSTASGSTLKNIQAHVDFLTNSLEMVDTEIGAESDTRVPNHVLQEITADYRNRELTVDDMNEVAELVTIAYQERGYLLAQAVVPVQEIEDGILKIAISEGDIGEIKVTGQKYYSDRVIKRNFTEQLKHGVIREELLEKGLLLSKELPDTETGIVLEEGEEPGTANIILKTEDRIAFDMKLDFNNFGSELIGKERYGTSIEMTEPYWGSTLNLRGVTGNDPKDSSLLSGELSIPVSDYGTKLNLKYLDGAYIVGQELADLGLTGGTQVWGFGFYHPISRTRNKNLTLSFGFENKYTESLAFNEIQNVDDLNVGYVILDYDSLDRFLGKNIFSFSFYKGSILPDEKAPVTRATADLRFHHYNVNLARIQKIYGNVNVLVRASGQKSNRNLLPIEQMAIGGYGTVRGHQTTMFLGDSGYTLSTEFLTAPPFIANKVLFDQRIAQMVQLAAFYDYGRVYLSKPVEGDPSKMRIGGFGGGLRLFYKDLFTFKFDVGIPVRRGKVENEDSVFYYFTSSINLTSRDMRLKLNKFKDTLKNTPEAE